MIEVRQHHYRDGSIEYAGAFALDSAVKMPRPGVMVAHAFGGLGEFEIEQAKRLAGLGYVGLAIDLYGGGKRAASREEAFALMGELNACRGELRRRMLRAHDELKSLPAVDDTRTAAIGFCFGGKAALDLARSGERLSAIVSFHGIYDRPAEPSRRINAPVLVLHGWDDPLSPPEAVAALARELTETCPDWQLAVFGNTCHAFTNPAAVMPENGFMYSPLSSARAFRQMEAFLAERFAAPAHHDKLSQRPWTPEKI